MKKPRMFTVTIEVLEKKFQMDFRVPVGPETSSWTGHSRLKPQAFDTGPPPPVACLIPAAFLPARSWWYRP